MDIGFNALKGAVTQPFEEKSLTRVVINDAIERTEMVSNEYKPLSWLGGALAAVVVLPVDCAVGAVKGAIDGIRGEKSSFDNSKYSDVYY